MPQLNIQNFFQSDTQTQLVSKLNSNFNSISNYNGSSFSETGPTGDRGMIGPRGPQGATGNQGKRGNRWFVDAVQPDGNYITQGDLWLDSEFNAYIFTESGWTSIGSFKRDQGLFKNVTGVLNTSGSASGTAIAINDIDPSKYSFVFSDDLIADSGNINELGAKFMIASNPSKNGGFPLEFSRLDSTYTGPTGNASDIAKHPFFAWKGSEDEQNIELAVPSGNLNFSFSEGKGKDFNLSAQNDVSFGVSSSPGTISSHDPISLNAGLDVNITSFGTFQFTAAAPDFPIRIDADRTWLKEASVSLFPKNQKSDGYLKIERILNSTESSSTFNVPLMVNSRTFYYWDNPSFLFTDTKVLADFRTSYNNETTSAFKVVSNGKTFTKKTSERYDRPTTLPVFTPSVGGTVSHRANWYELPVPKLLNGRTIFINPQNSAVGSPTLATAGISGNYIGIGIDKNDWVNSDNLALGQMVTYRVICGRSSFPTDFPSLSGFSMFGYWTTTRPTTFDTDFFIFGESVNNLNICTEVDVSITNIGGGVLKVYLRAYSLNPQKGGWQTTFNT